MSAQEVEQQQNGLCFPKLHQWYLKQSSKPPRLDDLNAFHLYSLAKSLYSNQSTRQPVWMFTVDQITSVSPSILQHILETDALAVTLDASLLEIYGSLAEHAILNQQGHAAFTTLAKLAESSQLAGFRFLTAWTAFNLNQLDVCINECERVNEPFAPIHTLLGQALLESGKVTAAIDALKVATEMAPNDPLPLVQLIKALLVTGAQMECFTTIDRCRRIIGNHLEIECLASMAILAGGLRPLDFCTRTLENIGANLEENPDDMEAFAIGMELASELQVKDWARRYAETWTLSNPNDLQSAAKQVAKILKSNAKNSWHDVSKIILDKTVAWSKNTELDAVMQ